MTLENTYTSPLTNVFLKDNVPNGLLFVAGGVIVNGVSEGSFDPNVGFTIPNIPGGSTATITFDAVVNAVPTPNPALNTATINYSYTPVEGGIENNFTVDSNTVPLEVRAVVADVGVIKTGSSNPVMSGEPLTYTIDVSNLGPGDAQNVVLTDTIPPEITGAEFSTDGGVTFSPWSGSFNIGTLLNQETRTILIRGTVGSVAPGFITNTAEVTSTTPDPNLSNNTSTSVIEVNESTEEADVGVFKSVGLNPVPAGEVVVFPIRVSNFGPADAQNVVLTDTIPPEITGAEFSEDGGSAFSPWPGSLVIGTLLNGETRDILIRGTVSPTAAGIISNTATVTSTTPDPNPSNNISTVDVEVLAPVVADVSVVKTANPNPVMAGELLTYTINVTNFGPSSAENVVLTDVISPEITGAEFSTNGEETFSPWPGSLNIGTLSAGETRTILIRGIVSPIATGIISNTATVTSTTPDPNPNNNTSTVEVEVIPVVVGEADISVVKTASPNPVAPGEADVSVVKTASPNPVAPEEADVSVVKTAITKRVRPGDTVVYTIVVSNAGPAAAQNVVVTDTIPPEIIRPEFSINGGLTFSLWPGSFDIGTLPAGASITIIIRGKVVSSSTKCKCITTITNTAKVTSTTPYPNLNNNTSTVTIKFYRCFKVCCKCCCCNKCKCDCKNEH